ncbi:1,4-dihydroxy-2-naphthoate octaprenyltransferase [Lentiprolixibacter aurantiacus]|uniref:1,4-dihydroxy-2-naphthoate octaprenyltransferase n=1 Tax=Lentiprolixibacter aurantiacus TaxID=2993939 RepID=A0AAE3MKP2_9FLAO|nr:1,4-dihydroxy-2-naphthoate octaprenyltransferase [Lentiprolixibacter aurantiacus]MCX2719441.1 1,4-dihydroxy-2-naphthoate octaprenyltransferase [Lentiprolixibacter aurantiacus]
MSKFKTWVSAARLRTLPLSVSGILVGTAIAKSRGFEDHTIFFLALLTTLGFQITSNFANDYGDGVKGTDNEQRLGPARALQSGALSRKELEYGIGISIFFSLLFAGALLYTSFGLASWEYLLLFGGLALLSIWAAVRYTVGSKAYGYSGLGDLFVFMFFGLLSVLGTTFLFTKNIEANDFLPAITIGCLSTAVLNLNNLRDHFGDARAGKRTLVVKIGFENGRYYHVILILIALLTLFIYDMNFRSWTAYLNLLAFVPLGIHLLKVIRVKNPRHLDPELKKMALSTFALALIFYFLNDKFL